jgi:hypothetical protein
VKIAKTHKYMEPVEFENGHGFRTIVETETGEFAVISEIHRDAPLPPVLDAHADARESLCAYSLNEVLVFKCDSAGEIFDWCEIGSGDSTEDAFARSEDWRWNDPVL